MKDNFSGKKIKVLVAILAIVFGFMVAAIYNEGSASILSNVVGVVTVPLQRLSTSISTGVGEWFQKFTDYQALFNENQRLQQETRELRAQLAEYNTIKRENEQYQKIFDAVKDKQDWSIEPATVISRDSQHRFYSFTIDRGEIHGINYLDPVMSADGLVGYISQVGTNYSKVITILDVKVDVGVYDSSSRDIGVLTGSIELAEEGLCAVGYLPRDSEVKVGDMILTSGSLTGGESIYPRDIYVGKVIRIEPDRFGTSLQAVVEPATAVAGVKDIFVITSFEGQGKQD